MFGLVAAATGVTQAHMGCNKLKEVNTLRRGILAMAVGGGIPPGNPLTTPLGSGMLTVLWDISVARAGAGIVAAAFPPSIPGVTCRG